MFLATFKYYIYVLYNNKAQCANNNVDREKGNISYILISIINEN